MPTLTKDQMQADLGANPDDVEDLGTAGSSRKDQLKRMVEAAGYPTTLEGAKANVKRNGANMIAAIPQAAAQAAGALNPLVAAGLAVHSAVTGDKQRRDAIAAANAGPPGPGSSQADLGLIANDLAAQAGNGAGIGAMQEGMGAGAQAALDQYGTDTNKILGQVQASGDKVAKAMQAEADQKAVLEQARHNAEAPIHADWAKAAEDYQTKLSNIAHQAETDTQSAMANIQSAVKDAQQFQFKDFWASRSAFGTAMGLLSQALSTGGQAIMGQGGQPTPLDRIIAQDWEHQKAQYQQLQGNVANARSVMQDMIAKTGSLQAAELAHYNSVSEKFKQQLQVAADSTSDQQIKLAAMTAATELAKQQNDRNVKWASLSLQQKQTELSAALDINKEKTALQVSMQKALGVQNANPLLGAGIVGGNMKPADAAKVRTEIAAGQRAIEAIDALKNNDSLLNDESLRKRVSAALASADPSGRMSKALFDTFDVGQGGGIIKQGLNATALKAKRQEVIDQLRAQMVANIRKNITGAGGIITPAAGYLYTPEDEAGYNDLLNAAKARRAGAAPTQGPTQ